MKFIHTADLHIGKIVNGFSMLEDQKYILERIVDIVDEEQPQAVLIAGDVYDKTAPSAAAVALFDDFLFELTRRDIDIFIISGNHDSPERLSFGGRIMEKSRVHIAPVYEGQAKKVVLEDEYGPVNVYMLPFVRPGEVRACFPDAEIETYTDAAQCAVKEMNIDTARRNVLLAHQFVTGAETFKSEEINTGTLDNVDGDIFQDFDYTALGHVHGPQNVGSQRLRYAGTPLKYSFSECAHKKSVTVFELGKKGDFSMHVKELIPLRDMVRIKGRYDEVTSGNFYAPLKLNEKYVHITLTDEEDIPEALGRLRAVYPYLMKLDYDNARTAQKRDAKLLETEKEMTPLEIFSSLYELQNNVPVSEEQEKILRPLIEKIWEV